MSWVMAAISVASTVYSVSQQKSAAKKAAAGQTQAAGEASQTLTDAQERAMDEQKKQYSQIRVDQSPFRDVGVNAITKLSQLLGIATPGQSSTMNADIERNYQAAYDKRYAETDADHQRLFGKPLAQSGDPEGLRKEMDKIDRLARDDAQRMAQSSSIPTTFQGDTGDGTVGSLLKPFTGADLANDPGYQFQLEQGRRGIENQARARGTYFMPSTVKELTRYGQGLADTTFGGAFNRDLAGKQSIYNMLSGTAGMGQGATNMITNAGMNMGTNNANMIGNTARGVADMTTGAANARGASGIASSNAIGGGIGNAVSSYGSQNILNRILNGGGTAYNSFVGDSFGGGFGPAFTQLGIYG